MPTEGKKTTVRIIECKPVYHGTNRKGDEYSIYEITASKVTGELINEKLRSFSALPIGQDIEVTVSPYVSEQYGKSFTLYPMNKGTSTTAQANEIGETQAQQREMIAKLSRRVAELERVVGDMLRDGGGGAAPPAPAAPNVSDLDQRFGADPPFA